MLNIIMHKTITETIISERSYVLVKAPHPSQRHRNIPECDFLTVRAELGAQVPEFTKGLDFACES